MNHETESMDPSRCLCVAVMIAACCFANDEKRNKRATERLEIETVVILDAEYVAIFRAKGFATNQSLVDLMALKWAGVQAEWGRSDVLMYDIRIAIKEIVIWEKNPSWYTSSTVLENTLYGICSGTRNQGLWSKFDHIHLFTGRAGTDVSGRSYVGDICKPGRKCSVSTHTRVDEYVITAHELGHSMGMAHDSDVGCPSPNDGIMGSKTASWSKCSVNALNYLVQNTASAGCLRTSDVTSGNVIQLAEAWPGMIYTDDEICAYKHGNGFRMKSARMSCYGETCMNLNQSSPLFGVSFWNPTPTDGRYCGEEMVCSSQIVGDGYECISWARTGLKADLFKKVTGGWSTWGAMTSCSRTCGTGIRYRQRFCNNPRPQNRAWCIGNEFEAETCNTQACEGDSSVESELIVQRASETCRHWKINKLFDKIGKNSTNYLNTGTTYGNRGDSQCEVNCDVIAGYSADGEKHGIIPDGTPCTHASLSSFAELYNLPSKSGMYGKCVHGYCYLFGCDNKTGTIANDGCGVCGGNNSTCHTIEGLFSKVLATNERAIIAVLPKNASSIQFYFAYVTMQYHFLEVLSKDTNSTVISYRALDTTNNPVNFAGTYWYLNAYKQFLYAKGPIDQEVIVQLFNYLSNKNTGVHYAYSVPPSQKNCTNPPVINYGMIVVSDSDVPTYGASARVICKAGYQTNKETVMCNASGIWEDAECTAINCSNPPIIANGKIVADDSGATVYGASARVICNPGYQPNKDTVMCNASGIWDDVECTVKDCGPVENILYGNITVLELVQTTFGSVAYVRCQKGYRADKQFIRCMESGKWEESRCRIAGNDTTSTGATASGCFVTAITFVTGVFLLTS